MKFAIVGVTLSGNMGGAAMLVSAVEELQLRYPGATFSLLSIAPERDRKMNAYRHLTVVSAKPFALILVYLPLAILCWPFARSPSIARMLSRIPYFRALGEADWVIDLCGIAFVDGRGLPLLAYNVACCLPAITRGVPIAKLAQALGPFRTTLNRLAARFVLRRCRKVVARGAVSLEHLHEIGITNAIALPDVSFAMRVRAEDQARADEVGIVPGGGPLVLASPSEVVNRLCAGRNISFEEEFTSFLQRQIDRGWRVLIVAHSVGRGTGKNNDVDLCARIARRLNCDRAVMLPPLQDPRTLRAVLGMADVFVGCRFHSVVGALAMGVPSLVIGWSHKYREMIEDLQPGDWSIDWSSFSEQAASRRFDAIVQDRAVLRQQILARLPDVQRRARMNLDLLGQELPA